MGYNINSKAYLYNRNSNDYIDIDVINKIGIKKPFPTLIRYRYRNYSIFDLFRKSCISIYPTLDGLKVGLPNWFKKDPGAIFHYWYGTHSTLTDMEKMLTEYKKKMLEGNIFLLNNDEKTAERYKRVYYSVSEDSDMSQVEYLSILIDNILNRINKYYDISKDPKFNILCDLNGYSFDIDKTVFIVWFEF